jgi:hypothetical protein
MALNYALAISKGLSKQDIGKLETLHKIMSGMARVNNSQHEEEPYTKSMRKELKRSICMLEYLMQQVWGFPQDKDKHYHWKRFVCLQEAAARKEWKKSGKMSPFPVWRTIPKD